MEKKTTKKPAEESTEKKTRTRKAPVKKNAVASVVTLQFSGKDYTTEALVETAKAVWEHDLQRAPEEFKKAELYVKPEESAVYYVINDEVTGSFAI